MCKFSGVLLTIMAASSQASMDLVPLEKTSCPTDDLNNHICYEMTHSNVSCANDWPLCNWKPSGKNDIHATNPANIYSHILEILEKVDLLRTNNYSMCNPNCTVHVCAEKCCEGWAKDNQGLCSIEVDGYTHCENGGTRSENNVCDCREGFAGQRCEKVVCASECRNGGTCIETLHGNRCYCPGPYYGPACELVECSVICLNGGECHTSNFKSACRCKEGYTGKYCAYKLDLEHCPMANTSVCSDLWCEDKCGSSHECKKGLVCCNTGCCNSCIRPPTYRMCWHLGNVYRPGQTFTKDKCTVCMCLRNGSFDCVRRTCSDRLPCKKKDQRYSAAECCPVCDNDELPPGYHRPVLKNCPDNVALLAVSTFNSRAYVTGFGIQAYDFRNRALAVNYHPLYLEHCKCPWSVRESQIAIVSTLDSNGQASECRFRVMVIDKTPPRFTTCPATIYAMNNEKVTWDVPAVIDNVGVQHLTLDPPGRGNDGYFTVGNHTMTYTATDYDGYHAFCQFTVFVYDKATPPSQMPPGLSRRHSDGHRNIQIIAGCLSVVFLVISATLAFCYVRRWRHRRANNSTASRNQQCRRRREPTLPSVSNGLYDDVALHFTGLDPKPPPYSPPIPPPAYEELAVNTGASAFQTEQPEQPPKYEDLYSYANSQHEYAYDNRTAMELVQSEEGALDAGQGQGQGQRSQEPEYDVVEFNRGITASRGSGSGSCRETVI